MFIEHGLGPVQVLLQGLLGIIRNIKNSKSQNAYNQSHKLKKIGCTQNAQTGSASDPCARVHQKSMRHKFGC